MSRSVVIKALTLTIGLCALLLGSEPTYVALADWPWSPSVTVNDDSAIGPWASSIAVDPHGNAFAVWEDVRDGNWRVYFSYRAAGGSWGPSSRVDNDDVVALRRRSPAIAVDGKGNAYAVWVDEYTGTEAADVYFASRASGGDWTPSVPAIASICLQNK